MKKRFVSSMLAAGVLLNSSSVLAAIGDHYLKENLDKPKYTDLDVLKNLNDSQLDILKNYDKFAYEGRDGKIYSMEDVNKAFKAVGYDNSKLLDELAKDKYIPLNQKPEKPEEDEEALKAAKDAVKEAKDAAEKDLTNKENLEAAEEAVKAAEEAIGKLKNPDNKANLNEELDGINKGVKDARDLMDAKDEYNDAVAEANEAGVDIEDLKLEDPNAADLEELKEATKAIKDAIAEDKTDEERAKAAEKAIEELNEAAKEDLLDEDNLKAAEKALEEAKDAVNRVKDEDRKAGLEEKLNEAEKALEDIKEKLAEEAIENAKEAAEEDLSEEKYLNAAEKAVKEAEEAISKVNDEDKKAELEEELKEVKEKVEKAREEKNEAEGKYQELLDAVNGNEAKAKREALEEIYRLVTDEEIEVTMPILAEFISIQVMKDPYDSVYEVFKDLEKAITLNEVVDPETPEEPEEKEYTFVESLEMDAQEDGERAELVFSEDMDKPVMVEIYEGEDLVGEGGMTEAPNFGIALVNLIKAGDYELVVKAEEEELARIPLTVNEVVDPETPEQGEEAIKVAKEAVEKAIEAGNKDITFDNLLEEAEKAIKDAEEAISKVKDENKRKELEDKLKETKDKVEEVRNSKEEGPIIQDLQKFLEEFNQAIENGENIKVKNSLEKIFEYFNNETPEKVKYLDKIVDKFIKSGKVDYNKLIDINKDINKYLNEIKIENEIENEIEDEYNQDRLKSEILEEITGAYYLVESELLDEAKTALDQLEEKIERVEDAEVKADFTKQVEELREVLSEKQLSYLIDSANSNIEELNKHWKEDKINFDQIKGQEEIKEELEKILSLVNKLDPAQQEKFKSETKLENDSIVTVTINKYIKEDGKEEKVESNEYYLIKSLEDELGFSDRKIKIYVDDIYRKDNKRYKIKSSIINPENGRKINIKDDIKNIEEDRNLVYSFNYSPLEVKDLYGEITEEQNGYILNIELPVFDRESDIESISINGNILEEGENYSVSRKNIKIILGTIDEDIDFEEGYIEIKDKTFKIKLK